MLHPIFGQVPINFFSEAVGEPLQAATGEAPTDEQAEPPVQPPAADHGADSAHVRRSANKALPRGDIGDQAQLHVPHACARKPAKPPPPQAEVFAIEAEVARGLARLTALSGMAGAAAAKAQLCILPVGPATAAHDRVLPAQAGLLCVWAGA